MNLSEAPTIYTAPRLSPMPSCVWYRACAPVVPTGARGSYTPLVVDCELAGRATPANAHTRTHSGYRRHAQAANRCHEAAASHVRALAALSVFFLIAWRAGARGVSVPCACGELVVSCEPTTSQPCAMRVHHRVVRVMRAGSGNHERRAVRDACANRYRAGACLIVLPATICSDAENLGQAPEATI